MKIEVVAQTGPERAAMALVPVHIDGKGPFLFALDTGASTSLVPAALAEQLHLKKEGKPQHVAGPCAESAAIRVGRASPPGHTASLSTMAGIYGTARGPLARIAGPFAKRARQRRHARFFPRLALGAEARILDVGCGVLGLRGLEPELDITGTDIAPQPSYPGPFIRADAAEGLPFPDGEFDLVYCSSVIEHVAPDRRESFAAELRRVGRGWMVQTPARSFPIEPHSLLPFAHWLPAWLRRRYWQLGAAGMHEWREVSLLHRRELEALFGPARPERLGPLVKSWVSVRPPPARG